MVGLANPVLQLLDAYILGAIPVRTLGIYSLHSLHTPVEGGGDRDISNMICIPVPRQAGHCFSFNLFTFSGR